MVKEDADLFHEDRQLADEIAKGCFHIDPSVMQRIRECQMAFADQESLLAAAGKRQHFSSAGLKYLLEHYQESFPDGLDEDKEIWLLCECIRQAVLAGDVIKAALCGHALGSHGTFKEFGRAIDRDTRMAVGKWRKDQESQRARNDLWAWIRQLENLYRTQHPHMKSGARYQKIAGRIAKSGKEIKASYVKWVLCHKPWEKSPESAVDHSSVNHVDG